MLYDIIRFIFRIPAPKVDRMKALSIAKEICSQKGWSGHQPRIVEGLRVWTIWINKDSKSSPMIQIDCQDGNIIEIKEIAR